MSRKRGLYILQAKAVNRGETSSSVIVLSRVGGEFVASMHFDYKLHHTVTVCQRSPTKSLSSSLSSNKLKAYLLERQPKNVYSDR